MSVAPEVIADLQAGLAALQKAELPLARQKLQSALSAAPELASAHFLLGATELKASRFGQAVDHLSRAVELEPASVEFRGELGAALFKERRFGEARGAFLHLRKMQADNPKWLANEVACLNSQGEHSLAVELGEQHFERFARSAAFQESVSTAYSEGGDFKGLADFARRVAAADPQSSGAKLLLAKSALKSGETAECLAICQALIDTDQAEPEVYSLLGQAQAASGRPDKQLENLMMACVLSARSRAPDSVYFEVELGYGHLRGGNYAAGWPLLEKRWNKPDFPSQHREFPQPVWSGEELHGRRLLVWGEQGIGDEIMFFSTVVDLLERGVSCVIECEPRLAPLYERSFPELEVVHRRDPPARRLFADDIDFQIAVGDLSRYLRTSETAFPVRERYLKADGQRTRTMRERYTRGRPEPLVGISWRSSAKQNGPVRSIVPDRWHQGLPKRGLRYVSVQYGAGEADARAFAAQSGIELILDAGVDAMRDMDTFASQLAALDMVVSVDNSTVHLSGSLGVPTLVMVPFLPNWRWQFGREDTPWYPSLRLFRQQRALEWDPVLKQIHQALHDRFGLAV